MKKQKIIFLGLMGIMMLNFSPLLRLKAEESNKKKHWQQVNCPDGVNHYEICCDLGDGERCYNGGTTTRNCPGATD